MSSEKINMEVSIERSKDHSCTGFILYCKDTERSIASFWNESDAENAEIAINSYNANQALISKQAEHIKVLRSTLIDTLSVVQGGLSSTIANGVKALEATKEQA